MLTLDPNKTPSLARRVNFTLPPELEAHEPPEARGLSRDGVRLLVTRRQNDSIAHAHFRDLPDFVEPGSVVVANDSATLPAAILARRSDGSDLRVHFSTRLLDTIWVVEPRERHVVAGEVLTLPGGGSLSLLAPRASSQRLWLAQVQTPIPILSYLYRYGKPIAYSYVRGEWPLSAYQTVYAARPGSAEMPSAGRAFTWDVIDRLRARGVTFSTLTLHTGVASLEDHEPPYEEWFQVPAETADAVNAAHARGQAVIAVGTTVVRALESAVDPCGQVGPTSGWTDLVVTPERGVRAVDGLLTGFHEPQASHLAMLEAFTGRDRLERWYAAALGHGYLWHEFGDLQLIL
jgi:S-adenosylmethionine:tRNA ribosyltransferase-isomerase